MAYVELHARSAFSFLRGGSSAESLAQTAAKLGLLAMALCDRNGVYGAVRFHVTAKEVGLRALVGCELIMEDDSIVPILITSQAGYRQLCALLTTANLRAAKGEGRIAWRELAQGNDGMLALTGDEEGPVRRAWRERGVEAAALAAQRLLGIFGPDRLYAELQRHHLPDEDDENDFLIQWARAHGVSLLATNGVRYAAPDDAQVLDVFTCLRHHVTLDQAGRLLGANQEAHVKPPAQMSALFADLPEAIANTARVAERMEFTLANLGYRFPDYPTPDGQDQDTFLRKVTYFGAHQRYGSATGQVRTQLDRELALISKLQFPGYFLMVWDLCAFARERGILVQGRGSAANSAVCYALGITAVDPIASKLLFERFLSEGRSDWPDIDLDFPSGDRREDVIQEVYRRYGRTGTAMTANVITYQSRITMREVGKVFGFSEDVLDRFSSLFAHGDLPETLDLKTQLQAAGVAGDNPRARQLLETCARVHGLPRHLGQHSGGMVLSHGNLSQFVPLENASMPGRSVIQWDKTDCEEMGIVKVDLLGLGMMAVLQDSLEICAARGRPVDLAGLPKDDPATFKAIQEADTVGMFQIESRAQMATLPRMKPETFYDLAIEVAIIRPGPIQGEATNPYLNRRQGKEPVTYMDERLKPILERTLGIVIFQEQILRIAMELANFTASEADELRRAIGFTRSRERLNRMEEKLHAGLKANGVSEAASDSIRKSLSSFALYGFPESHAISFALIAYASAWLRTHRATAFYAGLLNNQPMGFYSVATLVQDARRHHVKVLPVCIRESQEKCQAIDDTTMRLGFLSVRGLRAASIARILTARSERVFTSVPDFMRRTDLSAKDRRALALAGALNDFAEHRRAALWEVETTDSGDELFRSAPAATNETELSPLERMTHLERLQADYATLGLTTGRHPMALLRPQLPNTVPAAELKNLAHGTRVQVAGSAITRQRPGTAKGFCFITLEDETGHTNAIVRPQMFEDYRLVINLESSLLITGRVQNESGVIHVMAEKIEAMPALGLPEQASHDYH
ncbi:MAG: polymerase alpha subunit [Verrucomicrobia bacterium]|nr:polymerase alpha subunit [Verrucomicrobiota bacterium]